MASDRGAARPARGRSGPPRPPTSSSLQQQPAIAALPGARRPDCGRARGPWSRTAARPPPRPRAPRRYPDAAACRQRVLPDESVAHRRRAREAGRGSTSAPPCDRATPAVHGAHAAASDLLEELVVAKPLREMPRVGRGRVMVGAVSVRFRGREGSREGTARAQRAINSVENGATVEAPALGPRPGSSRGRTAAHRPTTASKYRTSFSTSAASPTVAAISSRTSCAWRWRRRWIAERTALSLIPSPAATSA